MTKTIKFVMVKPKTTLDYSTYITSTVEELCQVSNLDSKDESVALTDYRWNFSLTSKRNSKTYNLSFAIDTFKDEQLTVKLEETNPISDFDEELHQVKVILKNNLLNDWQKCIWLDDHQSEFFSRKLTPEIYRVENQLRQFINMVMVSNFGVTWWDDFVPYELKMKHQARLRHFRRGVPSFANVDDRLLSIDTDELMEVMKIQIKRWNPTFDPAVVVLLEKGDKEKGAKDKLAEIIKNQFEVVDDLWITVFKNYFNESFENLWNDFYINRNHLAHNKLIDLSAFTTFKDNIREVAEMITEANSKYEISAISPEKRAEMLEVIQLQEEKELMQDHLESLMEADTGITLLSDSAILSQLQEKVHGFISDIEDQLYFRSDLWTDSDVGLEPNEETEILTIHSNIKEDDKIIIKAFTEIDSGHGEESNVTLTLIRNEDGAEVFNCQIKVINGKAIYNDDSGLYEAENDSYMDDSELIHFSKSVIEEVNDLLPNLEQVYQSLKWDEIKDGGEPPVANFPCEECGEERVSINEELAEEGRCIACGHKHELTECIRCGCICNANDTVGDLCESCAEYIEKQ
ncbi:TraR/DksA C4-type zinc finger protein [Paenibacillus chitinolyticus]|uniref:TraR/DksA C4-type zinc finger protein n=1 Tax=Paenibacillus chitinolyticus TaxID=79263 RepID=UPI0036DBFEAC